MNALVCERTRVGLTGMTECLLGPAHLRMVLVSLHHAPMLLWYGGVWRALVWFCPRSPSHRVRLRIDALSIPLIGGRIRHGDLLLNLLLHGPATHGRRSSHRILSIA